MLKYIIRIMILAVTTLFLTSEIHATDAFRHPFYFGVTGGYGATKWDGLVPKKYKNSAAIMMSTPVTVHEGGGIWGFIAGYEPLPYFAGEISYTHYPRAKVRFDPTSLFVFNHDGLYVLHTRTETVAGMAKVMAFIPCTDIRVFSSFGPAGLHRYDKVKKHWRITPTFAAGVNYNVTDHIMAEIGGSYTAGFGESELDPAEDYMPFLYSAFLHVAYRF